jgi:hypothetical protein
MFAAPNPNKVLRKPALRPTLSAKQKDCLGKRRINGRCRQSPGLGGVINLWPGQSPAGAGCVAEGASACSDGDRQLTPLPESAYSITSSGRPSSVSMHCNFCRIHKTLRVTPATAAGVTGRLWTISDIVKALEDWEESR